MVARLWLLVARRVSGSVSVMILDVRNPEACLFALLLTSLRTAMRRVLHLKSVSQCTMLEDFGIFLVLADKSLFAYHIEALVPSSPTSTHINQTPQKLNGNKDVQFFAVGQLYGRTLVIWMRKKGVSLVIQLRGL